MIDRVSAEFVNFVHPGDGLDEDMRARDDWRESLLTPIMFASWARFVTVRDELRPPMLRSKPNAK